MVEIGAGLGSLTLALRETGAEVTSIEIDRHLVPLLRETVEPHGVTVIGPVNLPSTVPFHASQMFGRNVLSLLQHLISKEGALTVDPADEITGAMLVTHEGRVLR